ncbi:MAG TPA: hypothetical protein ENK05_00500 [Gammaproteobacteria bacterium]|nr:hypothetical protein [Gammaproteobacteria bacterium]
MRSNLRCGGVIMVALGAALLLSACGFHLRGSVQLPPVLKEVYLQSNSPFKGITPVLRDQLLSAGAKVVEQAEDATAVIHILNERSERRVLSVGSTGRASEYELYEEVTFSVNDPEGKELLKPQTLSLTRDLVFYEAGLLGKVEEAEQLRKKMLRTLSRQIITRIQVGMGR